MQTSKNVKQAQTLKISKKGYRPAANTAQNNVASWGLVVKALKAGPKSREQLEEMLADKVNHKPFVGYAIRRGWLV